MRVDEMISRATHTSGRSVLAVSSLVAASRIFDFELKDLPLLNHGEIPEPALQNIALWLVTFLNIAHIINWMNDLNGYQLNNKKNLVNDPTELHNWLKERLAEYRQSATKAGSPIGGAHNTDAFLDQLSHFNPSNIKVLWRKSDWSEKVALFVQHLVFPIGFGLWAIYLLFCAVDM